MKSPNEVLFELKELVSSIEKDVEKSTRGMKAAGIRVRSAMQNLRDIAIAMRKSVLEHRTARKTDPTADDLAFEAIIEAAFEETQEIVTPKPSETQPEKLEEQTLYAVAEQETKLIQLPEFSPFWYSDFNY